MILDERRIPKGFPTSFAKIAAASSFSLTMQITSAILPFRRAIASKLLKATLPADIQFASTTNGGSFFAGPALDPSK